MFTALLLVPLLAAGCSFFGGGQNPTPAVSGSETAASATPTPTTATPTSAATTPVPSTTLQSKQARLGELDVTFEVYQLVRRDDLVVLQFGVRDDDDQQPLSVGYALSRKEDRADVSGVSLRDPTRQLNYWPATSAGECVCSSDLPPIAPGETRPMSATFGALEPGTERLDVHIPSVGVFTGIPVQD